MCSWVSGRDLSPQQRSIIGAKGHFHLGMVRLIFSLTISAHHLSLLEIYWQRFCLLTVCPHSLVAKGWKLGAVYAQSSNQTCCPSISTVILRPSKKANPNTIKCPSSFRPHGRSLPSGVVMGRCALFEDRDIRNKRGKNRNN